MRIHAHTHTHVCVYKHVYHTYHTYTSSTQSRGFGGSKSEGNILNGGDGAGV
jgi:hypothetical protein